MEVVGILMRKLGERSGNSSQNGQPWRQADFLVEIPGQYPRHIKFSVRDGQVGRIARFESLIGKTVTVSFDIDAHEYEGRWFNELNAWGVMEYVAGRKVTQTTFAPEPAPEAATEAEEPAAPAAESPEPTNEGGDGLPF